MRTILNKNWCIDHFRSPRTFHKGFFIAFKEKAIEDSNLNETSRALISKNVVAQAFFGQIGEFFVHVFALFLFHTRK